MGDCLSWDLRRGFVSLGGNSKYYILAKSTMANGTVVTQTQLAIACILKPPPMKLPPTQVLIVARKVER